MLTRKIYYCSNLHLEFRSYKIEATIEEQLFHANTRDSIVVIARDLGIPEDAGYLSFLRCCQHHYGDVVLVAGNHEYYCSSSITDTLGKIRELCLLVSVNFLEQDTITIDGIVFYGTTLWSQLSSVLPVDYNVSLKQVVVTHHIPIFKARPSQLYPSDIDSLYYSNNNALLSRCQHWIAGHSHYPCQLTTTNGSKLHCNPLGYPDENTGWTLKSFVVGG